MSAIQITFHLDEEVTPELFAEKLALAVTNGCLRPNESLTVQGSDGRTRRYTITDEPNMKPSHFQQTREEGGSA